MRVLFVTQYFTPEIGATQTRVHEFARAFAERGHRVTVLTELPNHPHGHISPEYRGRLCSSELMDGFAVERVWVRASPVKSFASRLLFYVSFFLAATLRGVTLRGPFDVVVATSPPLPVGLVGWILARRHGARFVLDVRDLWPAAAQALGELSDPLQLRLAGALEAFLYRNADRVTAVTRSFVDAIARTAAPHRVVYVPNGASTDLFTPDRPDPTLRARLGFGAKFVVTFAGNLGIAQGLRSVLDAAALLCDEEVLLCFVGDGPAKAELMARAEAHRLPNVSFLPAVPTRQVTPYLLASDALLVTLSAARVFKMFVPSKLFDYFACARPVILMANGEARDILEASGGGVWVRPEDSAGLAGAIRSLAGRSVEERAAIGARGRAYVVANFSRQAQNERMIRLLEELIPPSR